MDGESLRGAVLALSEYFVGDASLGDTLQRVCDAALESVGPAVFVGISMTVDGRDGTYVFTDPAVPPIDRPQYTSGRGPCVDAFRTGEIVHLASTTDPTTPYPEFSAVAAEAGVHSVMSVPMLTSTETVGAINFYARTDNAFGADDAETARLFAAQAAFLLANVRAYWDARLLSENLQLAMESRSEIEQAKGILMGQLRIDADEAFKLLTQQSQHANVKLREVAREIVRRASTRPPGTSQPDEPNGP